MLSPLSLTDCVLWVKKQNGVTQLNVVINVQLVQKQRRVAVPSMTFDYYELL